MELSGKAEDFLEQEEKQEKDKLANDTLKSIEAMIDSGELDISSLGYSKKDLKKIILNAMTSLDSQEEEGTDNNSEKSAVDTEQGKQKAESNMQELNHTVVSLRSRKYVPLGKRIMVDDSELAVTYVEACVERELLYYEYILRWPDAITARYRDNPALAGVSLIGTVKKRVGNTASINLEIDEDDGYDN